MLPVTTGLERSYASSFFGPGTLRKENNVSIIGRSYGGHHFFWNVDRLQLCNRTCIQRTLHISRHHFACARHGVLYRKTQLALESRTAAMFRALQLYARKANSNITSFVSLLTLEQVICVAMDITNATMFSPDIIGLVSFIAELRSNISRA